MRRMATRPGVHVNSDEISRLQTYLEGAFPNAKLSPTKVFDAWSHSKHLVDFPNQRRSDLARYCVDNMKDFPTLQQIEAAARILMRREAKPIDSCLICDGTLWIHYEPTDHTHRDGSQAFDGDPLTARRVQLVAGKDITFEYGGLPVEYATPRPCPACNH